MKIKNTLLTYLSFGVDLKIKSEDNYPYDTACKLTFGASAVKSSLLQKDLKSILLSAVINTLPFAIFTTLILFLITAVGGAVLTTFNNFAAGFICYFIYLLLELFKSNYNHFKTHDILKPSLIIAGSTFLLSCGTVLRQLYHLLTKDYLPGTLFDFSAVTIIFALIFVAVLTKGKIEKNLNSALAIGLSAAYLISNVTYIKTFTVVLYIRLALVLCMFGLIVYTFIKENKGAKLFSKTPLVILGITAACVLVIGLILRFVFGDINQIKFILHTAFAGVFSGDINSLALLENTVGGGVVTDNNTLYGLISVIAYILPGSYLINALTMAGFNMGFHGENGVIIGALYAIMGFIIAVGFTAAVIGLIIEYIKNGKDTAVLVTVKRWVAAAILGLIPVTILSLLSTFNNLVRVSFSGIYGILLALGLVLIIYFVCSNKKINRNIVAVSAGIFTLLLMICVAGVQLF